MYLKYGSYQHAANEASVVISKEGLFSESGAPRGVRERWQIQGRLQAANQASLTAAIEALTNAYAQPAQDVGFYLDDGQPTSHVLISAATQGGVRIVVPPSFPEGKGAEYSTFRSYVIVLEAETLDSSVGLLQWIEVIQMRGGGPRFGYLQPVNGLPQKQLLQEATTYRATQSGQAVGQFAYPDPAAPLWPLAEHVDQREIRRELPKRSGLPGNAVYSQYKISWSYSFEDVAPLTGVPTAWPE